MTNKSPFFVDEEFLSPLLAENITDILNFTVPNLSKDGNPLPYIQTQEQTEGIVFERLLPLLPDIQAYYDVIYKGTESMFFEWYPQGSKGELNCGNSQYLRKKWLRTHHRDITGIIFLSDYQETIPFEEYYEVYGGKLEFPQWGFGFNPKRGSLIMFPSDPHFINVTTPIFVGDLCQIRFHITTQTPYLFNPTKFPGNYTTWFKNKF